MGDRRWKIRPPRRSLTHTHTLNLNLNRTSNLEPRTSNLAHKPVRRRRRPVQPRRLRSPDFPAAPHFRKRGRKLGTSPKTAPHFSVAASDSPVKSACVVFSLLV